MFIFCFLFLYKNWFNT